MDDDVVTEVSSAQHRVHLLERVCVCFPPISFYLVIIPVCLNYTSTDGDSAFREISQRIAGHVHTCSFVFVGLSEYC